MVRRECHRPVPDRAGVRWRRMLAAIESRRRGLRRRRGGGRLGRVRARVPPERGPRPDASCCSRRDRLPASRGPTGRRRRRRPSHRYPRLGLRRRARPRRAHDRTVAGQAHGRLLVDERLPGAARLAGRLRRLGGRGQPRVGVGRRASLLPRMRDATSISRTRSGTASSGRCRSVATRRTSWCRRRRPRSRPPPPRARAGRGPQPSLGRRRRARRR